MGTIKIDGQLVGTYQDSEGKFFARFVPVGESEIDIPITAKEFHGLIFRQATLTLELK